MASILNSAILVFPLKLIHTCQDWFPLFGQKKNFTHSFWLNLMMAAILNSAILDSDTSILDSNTLLSSLRFTQKHSSSTLTLTETNSIWLIVIHSHSTWWWHPSWIQPFCTKKLHSFILTQLHDGSHIEFWHLGFSHFAQKKLHSFILTQLDDGSHLEFYHLAFIHLGFSHLGFSSQTHSHLPRLVPTICTKKTSLIHSDSTDDVSHLEFCHVGFRHCHLGFRHLVIFSQIHSKTLSLHSEYDSN